MSPLCPFVAAPAANGGVVIENQGNLGIIRGVVRDDSGSPISDATVAIFRAGSSKLLKEVSSASDGSFLAKILPGTYTVSLVAFLAYMAILHARHEGLLGSFGIAAWSIVAFQTILMTYLGVNFVLASGLHSYGFGSSSLVNILVGVAAVETAFLAAGWYSVRRRAPAPGK